MAASEGHLHCLKYIVSSSTSISNALAARNDQVKQIISSVANMDSQLLGSILAFWGGAVIGNPDIVVHRSFKQTVASRPGMTL